MNRILSLIGVVLVVGCGPEPRDMDTLEEFDGVFKNVVDGHLQPYSGPVFEMTGDVRTLTSSLKDGEFDGLYEEYYRNGQLERKRTIKDGKYDGPYELYQENGQLESKATYKDGRWDGPYESYHENGQLERKGTYKDGKQCGEWIEDSETVTYDPCPTGN
jgi:antitoxin component YwqK of YwqJK toxin-antitoxin module